MGLQFSDAEDLSKTQTGSLPAEAPNACGVKIGDFRQITCYNSKTSTVANFVNLVRSRVYHTFLYSTLAVLQRVARVRQRQMLLVLLYIGQCG